MSAILAFNESGNLPFRKVTPEFLKSFEAYLRGRNCSWNTVSTYMRTLRAVYNRAVDRRIAPYVPQHFRYVYTGTRADKKRALEKEDMERLMKDIPKQGIAACSWFFHINVFAAWYAFRRSCLSEKT